MPGPSDCDGIGFGKVSAQDNQSTHLCTYYERVCKVCSFIVKSNVVIPLVSMS